MYAMFTDQARTAMLHANACAQEMRHNFIGTEHMLLGLLIGDTNAVAILKKAGAFNKIKDEIDRLVQKGPADQVSHGRLPQTARSRNAMRYAGEAARDRHQNYVDTEHLLAGLTVEPEGVAAVVLAGYNLTKDRIFAIHTRLHPREVDTLTREAGDLVTGLCLEMHIDESRMTGILQELAKVGSEKRANFVALLRSSDPTPGE